MRQPALSRFFHRIMTTLLVALWLPLGFTPAEAEPEMTAQVREQLAQFKEISTQRQHLSEKLQTLDVISNPELDDRQWWNPFYRASRENQVQRANALTLEIQNLNEKMLQIEAKLLTTTALFSALALKHPDRLGENDMELWQQVDAWRLPRLLHGWDWEDYSETTWRNLPQELQVSRIARLQAQMKQWEDVSAYLEQRSKTLTPQTSQPYAEWRQVLDTHLHQGQVLQKRLEIPSDPSPR